MFYLQFSDYEISHGTERHGLAFETQLLCLDTYFEILGICVVRGNSGDKLSSPLVFGHRRFY